MVAAVVLLVAALGIPACDDDTSGTGDDAAQISDLAVDVIDGYISADLMPIIPPDPIACQLTLRITNTNSKHGLSGLSIPSSVVRLSKNGDELGVIRFETDWDGSIAASEVDTVIVTKIEESQEIFVPPCREDVFLVVEIVRNAFEVKYVTTPTYLFSCPVANATDISR
jgi:hypothetical protein